MEHLFDEATIKTIIKKANPQSAAGSGLRYSHLHAALCDELVEEIAEFAMLVFSSRILPEIFWALHTSANLSALGQRRGRSRAETFSEGLLAPFFAVDTARNSLIIFSPGGSTVFSVRRGRDHGTNSHIGL